MLCIPPQINRKLRAAVESGQLDADKLFKMTTEERNAALEKYVGKNYVENINKRFVSKFNTELSDDALRDILDTTTRINKLRQTSPIKTVEDWEKWKKSGKPAPQWSREYSDLQNRMEQVVNKNSTLGAFGTAKAIVKDEFRKVTDAVGVQGKVVQGIKSGVNILTSPIYKSLKASMDLSYALRQGFKVFTQNPKQWSKSMTEAFSFIKNVGSKDKMDALMSEFRAGFYAHPNYDKLIGEGKLAFGVVEDWFPTTVAEKIPALGNIFKSSNDAFTVFSQSARFGLADDMLQKQMQIVGRDLTKEELQAIGFVANSVTGRGHLGRLESVSGALNKLFFSARYISSQVDTFTMPFNQKLTPFARQEALKASRNTLGAIAGLMATASFFGDVEWNPKSSNFGSVALPGSKARLDLTAGLGGYITLVAREATGETKNNKGQTTKLNTGKFGSRTRTDVAFDFAANKFAPAPGVLKQAIGDGELFGGKKPTAGNITKEVLLPISPDNIYDYMTKENLQNALLLSGADIFGVGTKKPY